MTDSTFEIRAIKTYVSYYVEMPAGVLEEIVERDDAAVAELRKELRGVPGLENLELDTSSDHGCVYFTLTAEEACEENLVKVEAVLKAAARSLDLEAAPAKP